MQTTYSTAMFKCIFPDKIVGFASLFVYLFISVPGQILRVFSQKEEFPTSNRKLNEILNNSAVFDIT